MGIKWQVIVPDKFYNLYVEFLSKAMKEFDRIYILNIAPTTHQIEQHSPGFDSQINKYNLLIDSAVKQLNTDNIFLIDINKAIREQSDSIENYIQKDGHHITSKSHKMYADMIWEIEKSI